MGAPDESHEIEKRGELPRFLGRESMIEETETLSPEDQFLLWAQHRAMENCRTECESRIRDEILSASCDCHGDSCCC